MKPVDTVILLILAIAACSGGEPVTGIPSGLDYEETAKDFAEALVAGRYQAAFDMLSSSLQAEMSASGLRSEFEGMTDYGQGSPRLDGHVETMADWPGKEAADIGWAYVSISGDDYAEAVAVIIRWENGAMKIRKIEWGRP